MTKEWENEKDKFDVVDVSKLTANYLPGLLRKAEQIEVGGGMCVVQSFEPIMHSITTDEPYRGQV